MKVLEYLFSIIPEGGQKYFLAKSHRKRVFMQSGVISALVFLMFILISEKSNWNISGYENMSKQSSKSMNEELLQLLDAGYIIRWHDDVHPRFLVVQIALTLSIGLSALIFSRLYSSKIKRGRVIKHIFILFTIFLGFFALRQTMARDAFLECGQKYAYLTSENTIKKNTGGPLGEPDFEGLSIAISFTILSLTLGKTLTKKIPLRRELVQNSVKMTIICLSPFYIMVLLDPLISGIFNLEIAHSPFLGIRQCIFNFSLPHPKRALLYTGMFLIVSTITQFTVLRNSEKKITFNTSMI